MPQGFFSLEELEEKIQIEFDFDEGPNCKQCGLFRKCNSPKMQYSGSGEKGVLILAEAPGAQEDQSGIQLVGDAGQLLRDELKKLKLDLDRDFWKTNSICCRPSTSTGANRTPTKTELKYCKPLVDKTIKELNPKMIWLLGGKAIESFYDGRFSKLAITRWRKLCIPDRKTGAWIIPMFHPSYINRNEYDENLKATFRRDLKWAASCINKKPFTWKDERDEVICLYDFDKIIGTLEEILLEADRIKKQLYIDYETNALKPQWPGAKIATISFCTGSDKSAIAFPYQYSDYFSPKQQMSIKALWRRICQHTQISFIAHNMKFEDGWTRQIFGVRPYSWQWDTMIAAHILDNRSNFSGLKFQSYINFGLEPYNKEVDKYLKAKSGHFNSVDKAPLDQLLLYNGLDTKMGMKLYEVQQKQFTLTEKLQSKNRLSNAYSLFHAGILALSDVQRNGIRVDEDYYAEQRAQLNKEIETIKDKLRESEEATQFKQEKNRNLDFASSKDLGELFYDVLKLPEQTTEKGNYRVDEDALDSIKIPFVQDLLQLRKLEKANGTYISQILREVCNGRIYPFYDLTVPVSFRSSSSMPNFQNIPIRDPEIGQLIRSGIFPSKGNKLAELDYSSIEVRIAAVVTGDPNLKNYVLDESTDMHRDVSQDIWLLPQEEVTKEIRKNSKGDWTFAIFYGSFYKNCAISLWKHNNYKITSGITLREHLLSHNITNFDEFTEHCREAERIFWGVRFPVYAQWKKDINELYRKQGFITNKYGFRFSTPMDQKQCSNFPIQSAAFHCLLTSIILINEIAKKEKWQSKLVGQIHDSLIVDLNPSEEDHVLKTCIYIMSEKMRELHPWIDVPIPAEIEITEIDQPWSTKKEIKI